MQQPRAMTSAGVEVVGEEHRRKGRQRLVGRKEGGVQDTDMQSALRGKVAEK